MLGWDFSVMLLFGGHPCPVSQINSLIHQDRLGWNCSVLGSLPRLNRHQEKIDALEGMREGANSEATLGSAGDCRMSPEELKLARGWGPEERSKVFPKRYLKPDPMGVQWGKGLPCKPVNLRSSLEVLKRWRERGRQTI